MHRKNKLIHRFSGAALCLYISLCFPANLIAQYEAEDPRKLPELTVCSQNLQNLESFKDAQSHSLELTQAQYDEKVIGLAKRFEAAACDVIAVQEVKAKKEYTALEVLNYLTQKLISISGRPFEAKVALEGDGAIRNGFIVARDRAEIINLINYAKVELPRLLETDKVKIFERAPLEIQLQVNGRDGADSRVVTLINFHLKSRSGAAQDPTGLQFETVRMQMAESIRRLVDIRHSEVPGKAPKILVLLGDRNTGADMAAARILEGSLALADFKSNGPCRLSKRGIPVCKTENRRPQKFFSTLTSDPESSGVAGSYFYKGEASWIDDILLPASSLKFAQKSVYEDGNYDSGTVSKPRTASDHSLVFVRLNW